MWQLATGQELFVLEKRAGAITSLAFASDGQVLIVAGDRHDDGTTVSLYQTGAQAVVADAAPNNLGR